MAEDGLVMNKGFALQKMNEEEMDHSKMEIIPAMAADGK